MEIRGSRVLVTGANRGLGRHLTAELVSRGAHVYAAARKPEAIDTPEAIPLALDITDSGSVALAASKATDITVLINNAGSSTGSDLLSSSMDNIRLEMETHYFGTLSVVRAFAPIIVANGGGSVLNILSVLSWITAPSVGAYAAAKSAEWSMTNAIRTQLAPHGVRVAGLHVGYMDTDMTASLKAPKTDPARVAKLAVDGIEDDLSEIVVDERSRQVQAALAGGVAALYPKSSNTSR